MEARIDGMTSLFSRSIGIEEPWYIRSIESKNDEVHIYVDIRDGVMLPCAECEKMGYRQGYEKTERIWRHGDCLFYPTYVHCRRPRVKCKEHGTKVVEAPWARKHSRFTLLFEGYAMLILADMPILKASRALRCNEKSLTRMMRHWVRKAVDEDDLSKVTSLGIDETSFKRGQSYVTVIVDAAARRVVDVEEGRSDQTVIDFSYKLEAKGGASEKIAYVTSDMSKAYMSGVQECFPYAMLTIDKFHVKKLMLEAMDEVRRAEQKEHRSKVLLNSKKLLMIPQGRQSDSQREKVAELSKQYPKTGRAFRMVQSLDTVYSSKDIFEARERFNALYRWLRKSRLDPMKKVALTLKKYAEEILSIFTTRLTNAICEGINSMIQAAKRKARGYHTIEGFSCMIYLIAAKLRLACPNPLRQLE
ncbi:MAG: ISL3 family transposase [Christensenellales bacterium]